MKTYAKLFQLGVALRKLNSRFDVGTYLVLLCVAVDEGTTAKAIQDITGIPQSTVSRAVSYLSGIGKDAVEGLKLIALEPNPDDRRQHRLFLTAEGKAFIETLRSIIEA